MILENYLDRNGMTGFSGLWSLWSDRITVDGQRTEVEKTVFSGDTACGDFGPLKAEAAVTETPEGLFVRDDTVTNTLSVPQTLRRALSRFTLPGGEYEVYTQSNDWEHESEGCWMPLNARASVWNRGIRGTEGAAPMMALWNRQNGRGIVFHVFANCSWKLSAALETLGGEAKGLVVECGVNDRDFAYPMEPGETVALPKIIFYTFKEKRDLECTRLHSWFLRNWPRREKPVIFNSWMMTFDRLDPDIIQHQAESAARVGAEYFVIDAGWFGTDGRWYENIGNWVENTQGAFRGRMREVADKVRSLGMKFGLWLEPERALADVPAVREHPEWFFTNGTEFLPNFGHPDCLKYMTDTVTGLIEKYGIDFIKFDFNTSLAFDPTGCGFLKWHKGHEAFIAAVRACRPGIYLENCASGGLRMEMYTTTLYDSDWISDNHGVYAQARILKDTALRLPPCCIDRWPVLKDAGGFATYGDPGPLTKLLSSDDSGWGTVRGVSKGWLETLLVGGALGLSFDLDVLSPETLDYLRTVTDGWKAQRAAYRNMTTSVIADGQAYSALQYNAENGDAKICLFVWVRRQLTADLYPLVCPDARYEFSGRVYTGEELMENGLRVDLPDTDDARVLELKKLG